jgi:hypothetical protein
MHIRLSIEYWDEAEKLLVLGMVIVLPLPWWLNRRALERHGSRGADLPSMYRLYWTTRLTRLSLLSFRNWPGVF